MLQTLVSHPAGESHPFFYLPLVGIEQQKWGDVIRMVKAYDPTWELVTVLLKTGRESAYRIGVPSARKSKMTKTIERCFPVFGAS